MPPKVEPVEERGWEESCVEIALIREKPSRVVSISKRIGKTQGEWKRNVEGNGTSTLCRIIDVKTSGMSEVKLKEDRTGEN